MALILPQSTDKMNNPGHSVLHRVVAVDSSASEQTLKIYSDKVESTQPYAGSLTDGTNSVSIGSAITSEFGIEIVSSGAIAVDTKGWLRVYEKCKLVSWTLLADTSGAIKIDVWKDTYENFPPTDSDSICNGHEPEISASGIKAEDTDLSDWTTQIVNAGDILMFNVDSCTSITHIVLLFKTIKVG